MADQTNEKKRKNKAKYLDFKKFRANPNNLDVNQKGFVVTCNFKEPQAVTECYNILNSLAQFSKEAAASDNVDDDLKRELEELKSAKPFKQAITNCKNVVFVRVNDEHNPTELMNSIYSTIDRDQSINCRFINKMLPIQITTAVTKKSILDNLATILKADGEDKATFRIEIVSRISFKLSKDELIQEIGELVKKEKPNWTVDLTKPKKLIYIDILFKVSGLSILDDYFERSKYNLNVYCKKVADQKSGLLDHSNEDSKTEGVVETSCPNADPNAGSVSDDDDLDGNLAKEETVKVGTGDEVANESEMETVEPNDGGD